MVLEVEQHLLGKLFAAYPKVHSSIIEMHVMMLDQDQAQQNMHECHNRLISSQQHTKGCL